MYLNSLPDDCCTKGTQARTMTMKIFLFFIISCSLVTLKGNQSMHPLIFLIHRLKEEKIFVIKLGHLTNLIP